MRQARPFIVLTILSLFVVVAPALAMQSQGDAAAARDDVIIVPSNDGAMDAAKAEARRRLPEFFKHLANPAEDEGDFSVKFNLTPQGDEAEFIWANNLEWIGDKFYGDLSNVPIAPEFSMGQRVLIPQNDIVDWGYYKGEVMQGNFTTRVLLDRVPKETADRIRGNFGW